MSDIINCTKCETCGLYSPVLQMPSKQRTQHVEELLRQTQSPSAGELAEFRLVVEKSCKAIQDIDQQISHTEQLLKSLRQARADTELQRQDAQSLLHPIRSLPNEIIAQIFSNCVHGWEKHDAWWTVDSLNYSVAPWTLTRVCSRWRALALAMPELWTYIEVGLDHGARLRTSLRMMSLYLERSQRLPLFVRLAGSAVVDSSHPIASLLESAASRFKKLSLNIHSLSLQCFSDTYFPRLEFLQLRVTNWRLGDRNVSPFTSLNAPMLRTFSTHRDTSWSEITTLPWSQFTAMLHFSAFDRDELVHLPKMANLEELDAVVDEQYETINEVMHLPNLRRLTLKETERVLPGRLEEFFGKLDVPNLADLALTFILTASKGTLRFPTLLTGASGLNFLTKLQLSWGFTTENWHPENVENILRFLSLTPRVSELVTPCIMPVELVSGLFATSGILPCLRVLDIGECLFDGDSRVALYDMLESRCAFTVGVGTPPFSGTSEPDGSVGISRTFHWRDTETDVPLHGVKCLEMVRVHRSVFRGKDAR